MAQSYDSPAASSLQPPHGNASFSLPAAEAIDPAHQSAARLNCNISLCKRLHVSVSALRQRRRTNTFFDGQATLYGLYVWRCRVVSLHNPL